MFLTVTRLSRRSLFPSKGRAIGGLCVKKPAPIRAPTSKRSFKCASSGSCLCPASCFSSAESRCHVALEVSVRIFLLCCSIVCLVSKTLRIAYRFLFTFSTVHDTNLRYPFLSQGINLLTLLNAYVHQSAHGRQA